MSRSTARPLTRLLVEALRAHEPANAANMVDYSPEDGDDQVGLDGWWEADIIEAALTELTALAAAPRDRNPDSLAAWAREHLDLELQPWQVDLLRQFPCARCGHPTDQHVGDYCYVPLGRENNLGMQVVCGCRGMEQAIANSDWRRPLHQRRRTWRQQLAIAAAQDAVDSGGIASPIPTINPELAAACDAYELVSPTISPYAMAAALAAAAAHRAERDQRA